jgi:hypothetical protein
MPAVDFGDGLVMFYSFPLGGQSEVDAVAVVLVDSIGVRVI